MMDAASVPQQRRLRVVTYNIRHGLGMDGRVDLARTALVLRQIDADIVCLQEMDRFNPRTGMIDQAARLAQQLGFEFALGINMKLMGGLCGYGTAILSRTPIYSTWNKRLPSRLEPRGLLYAAIQFTVLGNDFPLHVFCTHWGLSVADRIRQAKECAALRSKTAGSEPFVFCGDLNASADSDEVAILHSADTVRSADNGSPLLTYPSDAPRHAIDHILTSTHFAREQLRTVDSAASDHRPLVADLRMK